ncbi:MAG: hypothetical protein M1480_15440 [Bacteroidetes bacterium]|nr:hypothetical protein [Bacteroidota bacterium]
MDNSREESINNALSFVNNYGNNGMNMLVINGSNIIEPTITNGQININVS